MRDFMCVISGCMGLSSSHAWSRGFVGIFATSFGFIRCFRKPPSILQVNFVAWRPFHSLEVISQSFRSPKVISQPKAIFAAKGHFRSCKIRGWGCEMALMCQRGVLQPISQLRNGGMGCKMALVCQGVVSQGVAMGLRNHFAAGTLSLQNHFTADGHFHKGLFWAAKFRIPLFSWF